MPTTMLSNSRRAPSRFARSYLRLCELENRCVPASNLVNHGVPAIDHVQIEAVFYGDYWTSPDGVTRKADLSAAMKSMVGGSYLDGMASLGIGRGTVDVTETVSATISNGSVGDIQTIMQHEIDLGHLPLPTSKRLYTFFGPQGVDLPGGGANGTNHWYFSSTGGATAIMAQIPYYDGFTSGVFASETSGFAHEMLEAASDPTFNGTTGGWWYDDVVGNNEIADLGEVVSPDTDVPYAGYRVSPYWMGGSALLKDPAIILVPVAGAPIEFGTGQNLPFSGRVGTFTNTDPNSVAGDYTAIIDWGDNTTTAGVISPNGAESFKVEGTHTYTANGLYPVAIQITDTNGNSTIVNATGRVADPGGVLSGLVYFDANRDHVHQAGEIGQAGVTVFLDANSNGALDSDEVSTTTGSNGRYSFTVTEDGSYLVRELAPTGFVQTTVIPAPAQIAHGNTAGGIDFGNSTTGSLSPQLFAMSAGRGGAPQVVVYNSSGVARFSFLAYDSSFRGGVRVATADINNDGIADIITAPGADGGPHIRVFSGVDGKLITEFFAYESSMTAGVFVAAGDVDGDGKIDIITGAGTGAESRVRVFSGQNFSEAPIRDFVAYPGYNVGVTVAAGDINKDGFADIVTGPENGNPHVKVFDGKSADESILQQYFAYNPVFPVGAFVSVGDIDGDGLPDIVTGAGARGGPHVRAFSGKDGSILREFFAYGAKFRGGVRVTTLDLNLDGHEEIIVTPGPSNLDPVESYNRLRILDVDGNPVLELSPFGSFRGGAYVG